MGDNGKKSISFEGVISSSQAVRYLEGLAAAIKAGTVTLENEGDSVSLHPARTVALSIEAKRKEERERICVEISWVREREAVEPALKIHDKEPSPRDEFFDEDEDDDDDSELEDDEDDDEDESESPADSMEIVAGASPEEVEYDEEEEDVTKEKRRVKKKKKKKR